MVIIPNYEVALTSLANDKGFVAPIVALSFAWEDLSSKPPPAWSKDNCVLQIVDTGLMASLAGQEVLFPLVSASGQSGVGSSDQGLDRDQVLNAISAQKQLFVCAFNDDGDMIASIGFELK